MKMLSKLSTIMIKPHCQIQTQNKPLKQFSYLVVKILIFLYLQTAKSVD